MEKGGLVGGRDRLSHCLFVHNNKILQFSCGILPFMQKTSDKQYLRYIRGAIQNLIHAYLNLIMPILISTCCPDSYPG